MPNGSFSLLSHRPRYCPIQFLKQFNTDLWKIRQNFTRSRPIYKLLLPTSKVSIGKQSYSRQKYRLRRLLKKSLSMTYYLSTGFLIMRTSLVWLLVSHSFFATPGVWKYPGVFSIQICPGNIAGIWDTYHFRPCNKDYSLLHVLQ